LTRVYGDPVSVYRIEKLSPSANATMCAVSLQESTPPAVPTMVQVRRVSAPFFRIVKVALCPAVSAVPVLKRSLSALPAAIGTSVTLS